MQKTIVALTVMGLCLTLQTGCGKQPEQQARTNLQDALTILDRAEQGYTAADAEDTANLQAYRQRTLDEAVPKLEAALQAGDAEDKVVAARLLADIHASAARHAARAATVEYAALAARSATLLGYLTAVEQAADRIAMFSQDQSAVQQALQQQVAEQRDRQAQLQSQAEQLQQQIAALEAKRDAAQQQATKLAAEAQRLRQKAFIADGEEQYNLEDQAAEVDRQVAVQGVEADTQQAQMDVLQAELNVIQTHLGQLDEVIAQLEQGLQQRQQREQADQQQLAEVQSERAEAITALKDEFDQMLSVYEQAVSQRLQSADRRAAQAVEQLDAALRLAKGPQQAAVKNDLLAKRLTQVHLLTEHAMVVGGFGRVVDILAQRAQVVMPDQAQQFQDLRNRLTQTQDALIAQAQASVTAGQQLAQELSNQGNEQAMEHAQRLESYLGRLHQSDLGAAAS